MPAEQRRRWFQFSLRTLLILVTLITLLGGVATWWVTLPTQTWQQFAARIAAGDIDGANALCQRPVRVVSGNAPLQASDINSNAVKYLLPHDRTFSDMLFGRLQCSRFDRPNRIIEFIDVQGNKLVKISRVFVGK